MGRLGKVKWSLLGCAIVALVLAAGSVFTPDRVTDIVKSVANNEFACKLRAPSEHKVDGEDRLSEMAVEAVGVSKIYYQPVVILKEKDGELYLPILIGLLEVDAIRVVLDGIEVPRPLTPDLLCSIIEEMGASVDYIVINDLQDQTFYAKIALNTDWTQMEIDARPSDAIAIALRVGAPIYTEPVVLDKAGIHRDNKTGKYTITHIEEDRSESF